MEKLTDRSVREKMVSRGLKSLSDAELVSILIREGSNGKSALEIAESLLESSGGSLLNLSREGLDRLRMAEGIGMKRASLLAASFEMASRLRECQAPSGPVIIQTKDDVVSMFGALMSRLPHEEMWAVFLSSANGIIEKKRIGQGGVTAIVVDTKLIIKRAVELLASSIILVHNHPSGLAEPSAEDLDITKRISDAAAFLDIVLMDHIIIAGDNSYSFRGAGIIK